MSEFDKNKHLKCVIESHDIHLDSGTLLDNYKTKRAKVKDALNEKFKEKIAKIIHSGSYKKHTAINTKFDMDLCVHFKKGSFSTLKEMYDEVFKFLNSEFEEVGRAHV